MIEGIYLVPNFISSHVMWCSTTANVVFLLPKSLRAPSAAYIVLGTAKPAFTLLIFVETNPG